MLLDYWWVIVFLFGFCLLLSTIIFFIHILRGDS